MTSSEELLLFPESVRQVLLSGLARNVLILGLVSLFTDMSSEMIFAILPFFMTTVLGMNMALVGLVEGAGEAASSILKALSGWVSDRIGSRKVPVTIGYALSSLSKPLFALASTPLHAVAIRVVERMGKGVRTSPRDALIADSIDYNARGKAYGLHRSLDSLGAVLGPLSAFLLFPLLWYRGVFIASIIPGVISILLLVMFVKERREGVSLEKSGVRVAFRALGRRFRVYILTVIAFTIGNLSYAFFLLRAQDFGIKPDHAPLLYLLFNLVYAFSAFPVGYASDKLGKKPILLLGYIMFSVTCAGFASASSLPQVILLFVLYGASYALSDTLQRALVPDIVDAKLRGTAFGALHMSIGAAALPSSLLAGLLWQRLGAPAAFSMATAAVAFSAFMLALFVKSGPN